MPYGSIGLGRLNDMIDDIQAKIQARVGEFLGAKKKILLMKDSSNLILRDEATKLYGVQVELETQLAQVTTIIEKVKQDVYGLSDITSAASFYYMMDSHIKDVDNLYKEYLSGGGTPVATGVMYYVQRYWKYGLAGVVGYYLIKRR